MYKKIIKYNKSTILIFMICIFIIVASTIITNYFKNKKADGLLDKAENYETVISKYEETEGKYVYVEIVDKPYSVATETVGSTTHEYYIVYDKNNYMYVVQLKNSTYKKICEEHEKNPENFSYLIIGRLANVDYELEKIIIDEYNEGTESNKLNRYNYNQYFGSTYLNENTLTNNEIIVGISETFNYVAKITAIVYLVIIIKGIINIKNSLKYIDKKELNNQLLQTDITEYSKAKIVLSDDCFISMYVGMIASNYSDIAWVYISHNPKTRLGFSYHSTYNNKSNMIVYLKNGKKFNTATVNIKEADIYIEIIEELSKKNPNIMIGYSYENLNNFKNIKNQNK